MPAQLHSSTAATTDQNGYIPHTTTFWNSGAQFHSGIVAESIVPSYTPPAPPASIRQRNSRPKRLPTYLHTTAFWNSDGQFHSGMVTESIIPPAPAAHNTIAIHQPRRNLPKRLPTYLSQHSGTLVASSIPESSHNNKLWKTESRKSRTVSSRTKAPECPENIRTCQSSSSTFSASTQVTLSFQKMLIFLKLKKNSKKKICEGKN